MGTRTGEITLPFLLLSPFHWGLTHNLQFAPFGAKFFPLRVDPSRRATLPRKANKKFLFKTRAVARQHSSPDLVLADHEHKVLQV